MSVKKILLLLKTDRIPFPLIRLLATEGKRYKWKITIGNLNDQSVTHDFKEEPFTTDLKFSELPRFKLVDSAIRKSDIVIAIGPDSLLLEIADSCITHRKTLISPSRLTRQMALKKPSAEENNVLLLMDCGFCPGLDHVTAKKAIDNIHTKGGHVTSFQTSSGSFITQESIDNPLEFKLTEPVFEIINLGKQINRHILQGKLQHTPYHRLFERSEAINIRAMENLVVIPEGDSLYYRKIYDLSKASTIGKGKIVRKGFDRFWNLIVKLGLTDHTTRIDLCQGQSFYHAIDSLLPHSPTETIEQRLQKYLGAERQDIEKLKWLGCFDREWVEGYKDVTFAGILQHLLEKKLTVRPDDKDCIVMKHHLEYSFRDEHFNLTATLILQGESQKYSALGMATGFTIGAAVKSLLLGNITLKGIHIPVRKEIYDPMLNELEDMGIAFHIEEKKLQQTEMGVG